MAAVVIVVGVNARYALGGWERPWAMVQLVFVLAPVCVFCGVLVAMALSLALTEPLEPPPTRIEVSNLTTTPERTRSATSARRASPTAYPSPSATLSVSPFASPFASPGAGTPPA